MLSGQTEHTIGLELAQKSARRVAKADVAGVHMVVAERKATENQGGGSMNGAKLYVGNLSYSVTDEQLKELFSEYGEVKQANVIEG